MSLSVLHLLLLKSDLTALITAEMHDKELTIQPACSTSGKHRLLALLGKKAGWSYEGTEGPHPASPSCQLGSF